MKKLRFGRAWIACTLAVSMLLGTCATTFAASSGDSTTLRYVSLGDSMTNGYGLDGYDGNTGVEDYGDDSYANLFAEWLKLEGYAENVEHAQLAMSAMRAEDLHWLLELDYTDDEAIAITDSEYDGGRWAEFGEDEWNEKFTTGDYWTWNELCDDYRFAVAAYAIENDGALGEITTEEARIVAEYYQNAVQYADIISLGMGNGNFGVFAFGRLLEAIGFGVTDGDDPGDDNAAEKDAAAMQAMIYKVDHAISECDPAMQEKILELKGTLYEKVSPLREKLTMFSDTQWEALLNTVVYTGLSYVLNYAGSLEAILQLNPDAEIILVALMNTFAEPGAQVDYANIQSIGDVMGAIFEPLNMFIAGLPTFMQAMNNGVYKDATFYYAEAPEVECLVNTWTGFEGASTSRDRFVKSIVGTSGEPGMVWKLLSPMVGGMIPGASLSYISLTDVVAYEAMTNLEKAAYAAVNMNDAISCALYLAFEDAIVAAVDGAPVDLNSVLGLGNMGPSLFGGVFDSFNANIASASLIKGAEVKADAAAMLAASANAALGAPVMSNDVALSLIEAPNQTAAVEAVARQLMGDNAINGLIYVHGSFEEVLSCEQAGCPCEGKLKALNDGITLAKQAANNADLFMLLALPETLSAALQNTPEVYGLLGLFARCIIGNGLGAHPSETGHNQLYNAVAKAYSEGYTAKDETIKNVTAIINEYYDEAYAYAYAQADKNGYVDKAADAVDAAIKTIYALDLSNVEMTEEFRAKLEAELGAVVLTLEEVKTVLKEDKASDVDGLVQSVSALWDDLNTHLANAGAILDQAEFDIKTLVVPVVDAYVSALVESLKETAGTEIVKASHKPYKADDDSYYVAIGGSTVKGVGIGRRDSTYFELLSDALDVDYNDIAQERLPFAGAYDFVIANASEIAQADLITYQSDASSFVYALLADTPDWSKYIDEETGAYIDTVITKTTEILAKDWNACADEKIEKLVAEVKSSVMEYVPENIPFAEDILDACIEICISYAKAEIAVIAEKKDDLVNQLTALDEKVTEMAEKLAYAAVAYAIDTAKIAEAIQTINPDATLLVVGMYNPLKGLEIVANGTSVDAGAMFEYVIDATNIYYTGLAAKDKGFAFVDVSDAETAGFASAIDVDTLDVNAIGNILLDAEDSMHASAAGHEYIKDQILESITCDNSVYEAIDENDHAILCAICGEAAGKEAHSFEDDVCTKCGYEVVADDEEEEEEEDKKHYGGGGGSSVIQFTIKFETNGGNAVEKVVVKSGSKLAAPTAPTKAGFDFDGWYTDKALTQKYDFDKPVTKAFTLYAKWVTEDILAKFVDLSKDAWYYDYVKAIVEKKFMNGISATEFAPNATLTRGMFVTILHRIEGVSTTENAVIFTDVPADQYYANAVAWANANGIVLGITDTEFAPNAEVTREQMAAMLARYIAYKKVAVSAEGDVAYTDIDGVSEYAKEAVAIANKLGILIGNADGSFAPKRNSTRAEAAALFARLYNALNK